MLMFPSGGDFFDMNKISGFFFEIPDWFPTQPTHKYSMVVWNGCELFGGIDTKGIWVRSGSL